jgi:hypothetical protein
MPLRPSTRQFIEIAIGVAGAIPFAVLVTAHIIVRSGGTESLTPDEFTPFAVEFVLALLISVLGIAIAWFRLAKYRKERRNRPPPLDLT